MPIKVIDGIVHYKKKNYKEGDVIKKINKNEEERLIKLGVAVSVDMIESTEDTNESDTDIGEKDG